ncbi:phage tail protein [Enterobacter kobei]|uniref:phage tail protein n=1 Tax=Enterobacter kobei TaxID=208224 RepID=UPI0032AF6C9F
MADAPVKVNVQSRRVDLSILPDLFSLPYKLYVIQQNTDMLGIADAANNAGELAYEATVKNEEQDITLADHEGRISALRIEVDDHEIRITSNTSAISSLTVRVTNAEGNITTIQADVSTLQTNVSSLTTRVTTAEGSITTLQGDYVSKSAVASQTLASPLNVTTSYSVGGTKVVGARNTGWTAATGTALLGSFNANQAYTASATYTQSEVTAIGTGLQQVRQRAKAIEDALRTHGLIN